VRTEGPVQSISPQEIHRIMFFESFEKNIPLNFVDSKYLQWKKGEGGKPKSCLQGIA